jgi:hypothetical protein
MVILTHVRFSGGETHAHISDIRWFDPEDGDVKSSTQREILDWIRHKGGVARVTDGARLIDVRVFDSTPPYIRTWADGDWADDLLARPRF